MKLKKENTIEDIGMGKIFWIMTKKAWETNVNMAKWNLIKLMRVGPAEHRLTVKEQPEVERI